VFLPQNGRALPKIRRARAQGFLQYQGMLRFGASSVVRNPRFNASTTVCGTFRTKS
jgi:hypothetical protein